MGAVPYTAWCRGANAADGARTDRKGDCSSHPHGGLALAPLLRFFLWKDWGWAGGGVGCAGGELGTKAGGTGEGRGPRPAFHRRRRCNLNAKHRREGSGLPIADPVSTLVD